MGRRVIFLALLIDTHALIWWSIEDPQLSLRASNAIRDESNEVYVSAATAWEIATKHRVGRLPEANALVFDIEDYMASQNFLELPVTISDALRAGSLPGPHRDPFDRMLIAQAISEDLVLVSNETLFDRYGVRRLW